VLFTPEAHEALDDEPWMRERARAAIAAIVADAESAFDDGWKVHPLDAEPDDPPDTRFRTVYLGGAGVVDALEALARRGFADLGRDYLPYLERCLDAAPDFPGDDAERSLWMGETGIRLVVQRLAPSRANLERLSELIAANERDERCELMWGSPGTILAGRELGLDVTASVEWLRAQRDADGLWTQRLYGQTTRYLGPAHGFAGCALALGEAAGLSRTLERFAVEEGGAVNWPPLAGRRLDENGDGTIRVQWCHGAPGIVATLAHLLDEEIAVAGGELTWRAGPLRKGAGLCHGTAGNGYAFLALLERTGDELWLERARAFAMHAAGQVERARSEHGRGRQTLWTGDLGTALFLADCLDGGGNLPLPSAAGARSVEAAGAACRSTLRAEARERST
jgi:lanthionine synthetase-like protein